MNTFTKYLFGDFSLIGVPRSISRFWALVVISIVGGFVFRFYIGVKIFIAGIAILYILYHLGKEGKKSKAKKPVKE